MKTMMKNCKVLLNTESDYTQRDIMTGNGTFNQETKTFVFVEARKAAPKKNPLVYNGDVLRVRKTASGVRFTCVLDEKKLFADVEGMFNKLAVDFDNALEAVTDLLDFDNICHENKR